MNTKALFVAWQDPASRSWFPVGKLTHESGVYEFAYTRGATQAESFRPFGRMTELDTVYRSTELFPLFSNRILPKSRPEYRDYMRWLGLSPEEYDELEELARTGGQRATDSLEIFPCPEPTADKLYVVYFFSHGLRYLIPENLARISTLVSGEKLLLAKDVQNKFDETALILRTEDPMSLVGYCPRYYSSEFSKLLDLVGPQKVEVSVERVNLDAPTRLRLLCKVVAPWPAEFSPCAREMFETIAQTVM